MVDVVDEAHEEHFELDLIHESLTGRAIPDHLDPMLSRLEIPISGDSGLGKGALIYRAR